MKKDPVCGAVLDVREASAFARYRGRYHYFCSLRCRDAFQRSPGLFAGALSYGEHRLVEVARAHSSRPKAGSRGR